MMLNVNSNAVNGMLPESWSSLTQLYWLARLVEEPAQWHVAQRHVARCTELCSNLT